MRDIQDELKEHIGVLDEVLTTQVETIHKIALLIPECHKNGGKVVLFGNGGSAADAQHIAAELVGRYKAERKSLAAISLVTDISVLSAIGNDYHFDQIFERQVEGLVSPNDLVIGISTSGNSENVIKGISKAIEIGAVTIAFTGRDGGRLKEIAEVSLCIPSDNTPRIQEAHITVGHIICGLVDKEFINDTKSG